MTDVPLDFRQDRISTISLPSVGLVFLTHVAVLWLLMSLDVVSTPLQLKPLMVQLIPPQVPEIAPVLTPPQAEIPKPTQPPQPPKSLDPPRPAKAVRPRPSAAASQEITQPRLAVQTDAPAAADANTVPLSPAPSAPVETRMDDAGEAGGAGKGKGSTPRFDADYLHNPRPIYPPMSRRMGEEGKVLLRVRVEADGRPSHVEVKASSGFTRLDQAAEQAVRQWRFVPAKSGNEAISAWVIVPISFSLKG